MIVASAGVLAPAASAAQLCVGPGGGCHSTIQGAVNAANNGDRIKVRRGTYDGGVTIDVSVKLTGAGAKRTVIRGGGPVLTIGTYGAQREPSVLIDRVKITGGITRSSPESVPFTGEEGVFAAGGGISIPPNEDFDGGAKVTVRHSVITRNRVAPDHTLPFGPTCPDGDPCPFAFAGGGGIDSWGKLTLSHTSVHHNRVGSASGLSTVTSDADGGGITSRLSGLTITHSRIRANRATATGPEGRFAEGGGIYAPGGRVTVRRSSVSGNRAVLNGSLPGSVDQLAIGGGLQIADDVTAVRISHAKITRNSARMTNRVGGATANSGGLNVTTVNIPFRITKSVVARNAVTATAQNRSRGNALVDTGGATLAGKVSQVRVRDNTATAKSAGGDATASGGAALILGRMVNSTATDNSVHASSPRGKARAAGGGLEVDIRRLTVRETTIARNAASARGRRGAARGGGIFNARLYSPGARLVLIDSDVRHNLAKGPERIRRQGGGVYAHRRPVDVTRSAIENNVPDDCFGC